MLIFAWYRPIMLASPNLKRFAAAKQAPTKTIRCIRIHWIISLHVLFFSPRPVRRAIAEFILCQICRPHSINLSDGVDLGYARFGSGSERESVREKIITVLARKWLRIGSFRWINRVCYSFISLENNLTFSYVRWNLTYLTHVSFNNLMCTQLH